MKETVTIELLLKQHQTQRRISVNELEKFFTEVPIEGATAGMNSPLGGAVGGKLGPAKSNY